MHLKSSTSLGTKQERVPSKEISDVLAFLRVEEPDTVNFLSFITIQQIRYLKLELKIPKEILHKIFCGNTKDVKEIKQK